MAVFPLSIVVAFRTRAFCMAPRTSALGSHLWRSSRHCTLVGGYPPLAYASALEKRIRVNPSLADSLGSVNLGIHPRATLEKLSP